MKGKKMNKIYCGDCNDVLHTIQKNSVDLVITSPPYFQQREYGINGIGNEKTIDEYIKSIHNVFNKCVEVMKETGTIVFNIGDKYIDGNLMLIPYRFAIEILNERKVKLINEITWVKVNPAPKQDSKKLISSKEPFFVFAKSNKYYFDKSSFLDFRDRLFNGNKRSSGNQIGKKYFNLIESSSLSTEDKSIAKKELIETIREVKEGKIESFRMKIRDIHALPYGGQAGGRLTQIQKKGFTIIKIYGNSIRRDIIESNVESIKGNIHPAVYPEYVVQEFIKLLTKRGDLILDPFAGSGTTGVAAKKLDRKFIGIEINSDYVKYAEDRIENLPFNSEINELFL